MEKVFSRAWASLGADRLERVVRLLLLLVIFTLPFGAVVLLSDPVTPVADLPNPFMVPKLYLVEPVIALAAGLWAVRHPEIGGRLHPFKPLLGVLALAAISFWWAPYPLLAVTTFGHLFVAFLLLYVLSYELRDRQFFWQAVWALVASVSLQAAWGVAQFAAGRDFGAQLIGESVLSPALHGVAKVAVNGEAHIRAYGTLPHPNLFAAYLVTAILAVVTAAFWPYKQRHARSLGAVLGGLLGLLSAALLLTFSRTALLAATGAGALLAFLLVRRWKRLPAAIVMGVATLLVTAAVFWQPLVGRTVLESSQETGISNRMAGYEAALEATWSRPLGVGAGNFVAALEELRPELPDYQRQPAHNIWLLVSAELGLLAVLLLAWFVGRAVWLLSRLQPRSRTAATLNTSLLALAGTLLALGLVDHFFWSLPQGLWLAALVLSAMISQIPEKTFRGGEGRL